MNEWYVHEAYGLWVAENYFSGYTIWAKTLNELKTVFELN